MNRHEWEMKGFKYFSKIACSGRLTSSKFSCADLQALSILADFGECQQCCSSWYLVYGISEHGYSMLAVYLAAPLVARATRRMEQGRLNLHSVKPGLLND